jgi:hypothetical protein
VIVVSPVRRRWKIRAKTKKRLMFRLSGEDERLGENKEAIVISPSGEELVYYSKIKKVKLDFNEGNPIKERQVLYLLLKENKHKRVVKMNAGC